jgi:hypothetical protein
MKVKLFQSGNIETMEKTINDFISFIEPMNVEVRVIDKYFYAIITYKER